MKNSEIQTNPAFACDEVKPHYGLIDLNTGELLDEHFGEIKFTKYGKKNNFNHEHKEDCRTKEEKEKEMIEKTLGYKQKPPKKENFVWYIYDPEINQFSDFSDGDIYRTFKTTPFLCYNGYLSHRNGTPITIKDLSKVWGDTLPTATIRFHKLEQKGVFKTCEDKIYMNNKMFYRGRIKSAFGQTLSNNGLSVTRVYDSGIKGLSSSRRTRNCGYKYLAELIPYLNREFNVTCNDVYTTETALMDPLRKTYIARAVDLDSPAANAVISSMSALYIQGYHYREPAVLFEKCDELDLRYPSIIVNPRLFYAADIKEHKNLLDMFEYNRVYDDEEIKE